MRSSLLLALVGGALFTGCMLDRAGLIEQSGEGGAHATSAVTTSSAGGATSQGGADTSQGGSATSTGGGGQGAAEPTEDCLNGEDDDGDDAIDCDDDDCQPDYGCVAEAAGIDAYVIPVADGSSCPADAPPIQLASCAGCDCTPEPGTCELEGDLYIEDTNDCDTGDTVDVSAPLSCNSAPSGERSIEVTTSAPNGDGDCTAPDETVPTQPAFFCELSPDAVGHCDDAGEVCVPAAPSPSDACVLVSSASCPGSYPEEHARVGPEAETSCDCDCTLSGEDCSPEVVVSAMNNCNNPMTVSLNPSGCTDLGNIESLEIPEQPSTVTCQSTTTPSDTPLQLVCCAQ